MPTAATIQSLAALRLRNSREALIKAFESMPADKQICQPRLPDGGGKGRSAKQIIQELVLTNMTFAEMLRCGIEPNLDWDGELEKLDAHSPAVLIAVYRVGNETLVSFIEAMSDEHLTGTFFWLWADREISFAEFAFIPAWHTDYHAGQINYIQTLYGDGDDHSAPA